MIRKLNSTMPDTVGCSRILFRAALSCRRLEGFNMTNDKKTYYVSVNHNLIQDVPNDSNEYVVYMDDEEVSKLRGLLYEVSSSDRYAFKRTFVPYKSADHDDAAEQYDERTINLYHF